MQNRSDPRIAFVGLEWTYLKHREQQVLFSRFVLISVEGEHDSLEEGIDFAEGDQSTQSCDMSRFGLKEEEQI
jgi:hypothetical protein